MKQTSKICPCCGKTFVAEHNARKFCKKKCAMLAARKRVRKDKQYLCQWCGQIFEAQREKKFCNLSCQKDYMKNLSKYRKTVIKVPVKITIEDAAKGSKEEKLTYGRYVSIKKI